MATHQERLAAKEAKLRAELQKVEDERKRASENPPDVIIKSMFDHDDKEFVRKFTQNLFEMNGKDSGKTAKQLGVPTSVMHAARNYKPQE